MTTTTEDPTPEALAFLNSLFEGWPVAQDFRERGALALDAWGAALLRRQEDAKAPAAGNVNDQMRISMLTEELWSAREYSGAEIARLHAALAAEKAAHEATRKELEQAREALAQIQAAYSASRMGAYWRDKCRASQSELESLRAEYTVREATFDARKLELESLRKPLEGEQAEDVAHLDFGCAEAFVMFDSANRNGVPLAAHQLEWLEEHRKFGHVDRVRAALRAKGLARAVERKPIHPECPRAHASDLGGCPNCAALFKEQDPQPAEPLWPTAVFYGEGHDAPTETISSEALASAQAEAAQLGYVPAPAGWYSCTACGGVADRFAGATISDTGHVLGGLRRCAKCFKEAEPPEPRAIHPECAIGAHHSTMVCANCSRLFREQEPRPIVPGSWWENKKSGALHEVTDAGKHVWTVGGSNWQHEEFRRAHKWLRDPEPAAPAPELCGEDRDLAGLQAAADHQRELAEAAQELPRKVEPGTTLTVGARYRITEIASWDKRPPDYVGEEFICDASDHWSGIPTWPAWLVAEGTYVTGLELVAEPGEGE